MPIYEKRSGIMLFNPLEESRLSKWEPPYITQPKLDGVRCRALRHTTYTGELTWLLVSSTENIIISVPHIVEILEQMDIPPEIIQLDGELYRHGWSFEEINSVVSRTVNIHPNYDEIKFHVFDVAQEGIAQAKRLAMLKQIAYNDYVCYVPHAIVWSLDELMNQYRAYLDLGFEGIIVRHFEGVYVRVSLQTQRRSPYGMKFKPKKKDTYLIVDYKEEISKDGEPKDRLGALICQGNDVALFSVGSGLDDDAKERLWKEKESLAGQYVIVEYQHITSGKGVPRFPVYYSLTDKP